MSLTSSLPAASAAPAAGGGTRRTFSGRENLALLRGGSTVGPGNITLTYPDGNGNNNASKNGGRLNVTLTRSNGNLGIVGARFSPDPKAVGAGAAIYGEDYTYDPWLSVELSSVPIGLLLAC